MQCYFNRERQKVLGVQISKSQILIRVMEVVQKFEVTIQKTQTYSDTATASTVFVCCCIAKEKLK